MEPEKLEQEFLKNLAQIVARSEELEDLLILKLMTLRELDTIDTIALLLENPEQVNIASYGR